MVFLEESSNKSRSQKNPLDKYLQKYVFLFKKILFS
jgi:hypothetical protein